MRADVVIAGGGTGGVAAALAALRNGLRVVMTEETPWIGGQFTQQGVPPDEHRWIETAGGTRTYREFRAAIRDYYRRHYPLTEAAAADPHLNPGRAGVSALAHEPRVALAVLTGLLQPWISSGRLTLLTGHRITGADVSGDFVRAAAARSLRTDGTIVLHGTYFLDATETGSLLPLTGTEFVTGTESRAETGELHAPETANPRNQQAFTMCFAVEAVPGGNFVIDRPDDYSYWRDYVPQLTPPWPGRLLDFTYTHPPTLQPRTLGFNPFGDTPGVLNLWTYRRIADRTQFRPGTREGDISIINWPQNDYLGGPIVGVSATEAAEHIRRAKQLSLSLLYWLQTEAPREGDRQGYPELKLRPDVLGTEDGLAMYPYVRESRRIRARFTVCEGHVGRRQRALETGRPESEVTAAGFQDSIGTGSYPIDLHPSTGGDNYIDFPSLRFQIPLGALIPRRMRNLLPACKNIGTTHLTNGCYRLHPVEWNIGESAGALAAFAITRRTEPHQVYESPELTSGFQAMLEAQGVDLRWPEGLQ